MFFGLTLPCKLPFKASPCLYGRISDPAYKLLLGRVTAKKTRSVPSISPFEVIVLSNGERIFRWYDGVECGGACHSELTPKTRGFDLWWIVLVGSYIITTCWVYRGGLPGILTFFGVGWGGVGMIPFLAIAHISVLRNWCFFLALAHISMLRNWCFLHLHTSRCYATDVPCTCTHLGATQLMFLALAHISVLRNWCFLHLHTSRCYATDVSCSCTHLDATQLMFLARAQIWVLRKWCSLHLHTSRCYATDVLCNCTHLGARQLMFLALAHISMLRNWTFPEQDAPSQTPPNSMHGVKLDTL